MSESIGRITDVQHYIDGAIEIEMASEQRRVSLVTADELSRLGQLAFVGPDAEHTQACADQLARNAVISQFAHGQARSVREDPASDLLLAPLAAPLRRYAEARAARIVPNERKTVGTRAADGTRGAQPAYDSEKPPPSRYRGVYKAGEKYRWADEVTHNGCRWWAKWDTDARPGDGEGNGWQLTHKSLERARAGR